MQQDLDHDQSGSLETEGQALTDETDHLKVQLAIGGGTASERDHLPPIRDICLPVSANRLYIVKTPSQTATHGDDPDQPLVGLLQSKGERDQEDDDGVESLEHLDERDREAAGGGGEHGGDDQYRFSVLFLHRISRARDAGDSREVGVIAQDQTTREEHSDGQDRLHPFLSLQARTTTDENTTIRG